MKRVMMSREYDETKADVTPRINRMVRAPATRLQAKNSTQVPMQSTSMCTASARGLATSRRLARNQATAEDLTTTASMIIFIIRCEHCLRQPLQVHNYR